MSSLRKARSMNFVVGKKSQQAEEEHKPRIRNVTTFIISTTSTSNPFKDAAKKVLRRKTPIDEVKNRLKALNAATGTNGFGNVTYNRFEGPSVEPSRRWRATFVMSENWGTRLHESYGSSKEKAAQELLGWLGYVRIPYIGPESIVANMSTDKRTDYLNEYNTYKEFYSKVDSSIGAGGLYKRADSIGYSLLFLHRDKRFDCRVWAQSESEAKKRMLNYLTEYKFARLEKSMFPAPAEYDKEIERWKILKRIAEKEHDGCLQYKVYEDDKGICRYELRIVFIVYQTIAQGKGTTLHEALDAITRDLARYNDSQKRKAKHGQRD